MHTEVSIFGAGGHGAVVASAALLMGWQIRRIVDQDEDKLGSVIAGTAVGPADLEADTAKDYPSWHVAIGDNTARKRSSASLQRLGLHLSTVVHPAASVDPASTLDSGAFVAAGAIVAVRSRVGKGVIVNHAAIVDHDCVVGDWAHIAPGVVLGGGVSIGEGCLIGAGAVVLPTVSIGKGSIVGAGSVVTKNVGAGEKRMGSPARAVAN